ncbi:MAG: DJ-1/PfpI family protein [Acidobacteriota bacterium]
MKRLLFGIVLATLLCSCSGSGQQVLLYLRDGSADLEFMLQNEAMVMKNTLEEAGFEVVVATLDGSDFSEGAATMKTDIKLADANIEDYAGIMLPCLMVASYPEPEISQKAMDLVQQAVAAGKPVAAQTGSLWTLAKAGVLKGRKYAYAFEENHPYFEGTTFGGTGVVRDGPVLTSGLCPHMARTQGVEDGTKPLTLAFIEAMKEKK